MIPLLSDENLKNFALVIDRPPEVMGFAIDPHVTLIQIPSPMDMGTH